MVWITIGLFHYKHSINSKKCETIIKMKKKAFLYIQVFVIMNKSIAVALARRYLESDIFSLLNMLPAEAGIKVQDLPQTRNLRFLAENERNLEILIGMSAKARKEV